MWRLLLIIIKKVINMKKLVEILKINWVLLLLFGSYLVIFLWQNQIGSYLSSDSTQKLLGKSIYNGWLGLVEYLSAHVLFCLIPAFFIASALNTLVESKTILKYLSGETHKAISYIVASVGGIFIQVCSCTILPLFAGIWKKGAGLGIAITFLYAGPAVNILSFVLTGQQLGWTIATVRLILSIVFSIGIGVFIQYVYRKEKNEIGDIVFKEDESSALSGRKSGIFWTVLILILLIGTAPISHKVKLLGNSIQTTHLIVIILTISQVIMAFTFLNKIDRNKWWNETVKFLTEIIPLLLIGVFFAGLVTTIIPKEQFQQLAGENNILTNFVAVLFGAIAYFPALVEVPIAKGFLDLGMHRGPLMAYLLSDPVASLQGFLVLSKVLGKSKTMMYILSILVTCTLAGYIFGLIVG